MRSLGRNLRRVELTVGGALETLVRGGDFGGGVRQVSDTNFGLLTAGTGPMAVAL